MLSIELILATGSKAGTPAPIQHGYYMIGRHAECQIRPKSRSVSRRHCLLHHSQQGLAVFDLQSTRGTHVNEEMIEPHKWVALKAGDQIRCGKVCFDVSIKQAVPVGAATGPTATSDAWQEADIAQFLEAEDEAEREERYGSIRSSVDESTEITLPPRESNQGESNQGELDQYEDTPLERDDSTPLEANASAGSKPKQKSKKTAPKTPKIPKKKARGPKKLRMPQFSFSAADGEQWKLIGAVVLVVVLVGFLGYQVYQYGTPQEIRVLENID